MFRLFLKEKGIENCRGIKHITCGDEALAIKLVNRFFDHLNLDNFLYHNLNEDNDNQSISYYSFI